MDKEAKRLKDEFETPLRADIDGLKAESSHLIHDLTGKTQTHQAAMQTAQNRLQLSETSGTARHNLLWAAVAAGEIPWLEAYGLMAVALLIEGGAFLAKFILPMDKAALDRLSHGQGLTSKQRIETQEKAAQDDFTYQLLKKRQELSATVAEDMRDDLAAEMREQAKEFILPSIHLKTGLSAFEETCRQTQDSQRRTGQAAPPSIIAGLDKMGGGKGRGERSRH